YWRHFGGASVSAATVGVLALAFFAGELIARRVAPGSAASSRVEREAIERNYRFFEPCFKSQVIDGQRVLVPTRAAVSEYDRVIPRKKDPTTIRVAVIGESSAGLLGGELQALLGKRTCGRRYEVLNCGEFSAPLETVERRADEVFEYEPDAVILLF